jgi:two-component system response regulator YesN
MQSRILIVDDDSVFRSEFKEYYEEYGIVEAANGEQALSILKKPNEIDLVILDVRMSGLNGIETLARIRKQNPDIRVVILTSYGSKDVAVEALRGQADDFIEKPLDVDLTKKIIEKFLGTKRGQPDTGSLDMKGKIERVKDFVRRNHCKKITLKDAADLIYVSPKYLSRIFKELTGRGFNEFKLELRIEESKHLLRTSGYNINQVSDRLGYENPASFIRQFVKSTGLTPTQFRNKTRKKK